MSAKKVNTGKSRIKSNFRKGDKVMVIAGADKGKTGNVVQVMLDKQRVLWKTSTW
jgi:ribosomal protein L24